MLYTQCYICNDILHSSHHGVGGRLRAGGLCPMRIVFIVVQIVKLDDWFMFYLKFCEINVVNKMAT